MVPSAVASMRTLFAAAVVVTAAARISLGSVRVGAAGPA